MEIDNSQVKILLVDDIRMNLEIAGKTLEREGYDLYIADNGFTALDLIHETDFDLILLDIMMPEMDGFETCRKIRQSKKNLDIPIIFLTAKADIDSIVTGFDLGAVDYIRKPFNFLELVARVKTHVELKKSREEIRRKNLKLKEAYNQLKIVAKTDPLTGLINRREIMERIEHEMARYERSNISFTLIIGDIDYFKKVNDTYGHECGDKVLASFSKIFKNNTRKQDSISRWGGEEFLLLLPDTNQDQGYLLAEKLRTIIERTGFYKDSVKIQLTITFGVSTIRAGQTVNELISEADEALYEGKRRGRNCVVVAESK
ncbi:MAG: diguanylate cyclase [Clostridiales bacterium]|jgi:diguanylate cyclase (GGDEF)-like protein|nr:diguanylate cyclase [Clostridiales bacterium]